MEQNQKQKQKQKVKLSKEVIIARVVSRTTIVIIVAVFIIGLIVFFNYTP
jgi:hypothetical protein